MAYEQKPELESKRRSRFDQPAPMQKIPSLLDSTLEPPLAFFTAPAAFPTPMPIQTHDFQIETPKCPYYELPAGIMQKNIVEYFLIIY